MFSDKFLKDNHDDHGRQLQVVPLTIELRPLYDGSNYPSGFMVPLDQVSDTDDTEGIVTWFPNLSSETVLDFASSYIIALIRSQCCLSASHLYIYLVACYMYIY